MTLTNHQRQVVDQLKGWDQTRRPIMTGIALHRILGWPVQTLQRTIRELEGKGLAYYRGGCIHWQPWQLHPL
jgi:hypothetical protein